MTFYFPGILPTSAPVVYLFTLAWMLKKAMRLQMQKLLKDIGFDTS